MNKNTVRCIVVATLAAALSGTLGYRQGIKQCLQPDDDQEPNKHAVQELGCIPFKKQPLRYVPLDQYLRDVDRFDQEVGQYTTERLNSLSTRGRQFAGYEEKQASRQCTFSLARLKNFIYVIEEAALRNGQNTDSLGITWSYALYDNHRSHHVNGNDFRSLQTLYGMPSLLTPQGVMLVDINKGFGQLGKTAIYDINNHNTHQLVALGPEEDPIFNFGSMCPPACTPDDLNLFKLAEDQQASYLTP